jgi:hypothetical protein
MKYSKRSLANGLNLVLLGFALLIAATLAVVLPVLLLSSLSPEAWTEVGKPLTKIFTPAADRPGLNLAPWILVFVTASLLVGLMVTLRLRRIVQTVLRGDPFSSTNVIDVRVIALLLALGQVVSLGRDVAVVIAKQKGGTIDLELGTWLSIFILLVLAEVFREGARLKDEERMTA